MSRDSVMLILLISSSVLTEHQWVMERGSGAPAKEREGFRKTERKGWKVGRGLSYNWQLTEEKVEKKLKKGRKKLEIFSLPLQ